LVRKYYKEVNMQYKNSMQEEIVRILSKRGYSTTMTEKGNFVMKNPPVNLLVTGSVVRHGMDHWTLEEYLRPIKIKDARASNPKKKDHESEIRFTGSLKYLNS